ncbi:hypothetical protein NOVOSPHI9U_170011 [Novosphingobium sp. 9U]|nr:hypothetical protein NOVOSPHI9U_170011 [Novosphingobium sp. 9U]
MHTPEGIKPQYTLWGIHKLTNHTSARTAYAPQSWA